MKDFITLGKVKGSFFKRERLSESQLNHHVHIVGASGYGKTVLISQIVRQRIEQGKGLLFIDLKSDINTITKFTKFAKASGREKDLEILSLTEKDLSKTYNLISQGSANQIRDKIMMSLNWSEEFYKNQSSSFLLKLLIGLCWLRDNRSHRLDIGTILKASSNLEFLEELSRSIPEDALREKEIFEDAVRFSKNSDNWSSLQGLRSQLESIVLSDFGNMVGCFEGGIDLFESARKGKITYIFLDSRRYGETARTIGRFIVQDLKYVSARIDSEVLEKDRIPFTVIIDEFADMASEDFIAFLDRARSSKMSIIVAHQEICDLNRISPEFAGRLMGNTSTLYAFLQKRPESAEIISGMAGTRKVKEQTVQMSGHWPFSHSTGMRSVREVDEYIVHPNVIKALRVGKCVCVKKYPKAEAHLVEVSL